MNDARLRVRGARVRIEAAGQVLETTVIPPEGDGPPSWIGEAQRVEELYDQGLITIKLALAEAADKAARGKSDAIELGGDRAEPAVQGGAPANGGERSVSPIPVEQLARWRAESEGLDKLAAHDTERRARASVIDVVVVLSLLDEIDRLRRALRVHADDGSSVTGAIPAATLDLWREEAVVVSESDPDAWRLADRLLAAIDEIDGRRSGAAAALPYPFGGVVAPPRQRAGDGLCVSATALAECGT